MTRKSVKAVFLSLLAMLVPWAVGCGKKERGSPAANSQPNTQISTDNPANPPPPSPNEDKTYQLTVRELYDAAEKDLAGAKAKYEGATLELTGRARMFHFGGDGDDFTGYLMLQPAEEDTLDLIACRSDKVRLWELVSQGATATIRGRGNFDIRSPRLFDCEVANSEGEPPIGYTAEQLVAECAADLKAAKEKFDGQYFVVKGVVEKRQTPPQNSWAVVPSILLKGSGGSSFGLFFDSVDADLFAAIKPGDELTAYGACEFPSYEGCPIGLSTAKNLNLLPKPK